MIIVDANYKRLKCWLQVLSSGLLICYKTRSVLYMKINIHALIIMVVWHVHWLVRRLKKAPTRIRIYVTITITAAT